MKNKQPAPLKKDPDKGKKGRENKQRPINFGISYIIAGIIILWLVQQFVLTPLATRAVEIPYS